MSSRALPPLVAPAIVIIVMAALLIPHPGAVDGPKSQDPLRRGILGLGMLVYCLGMLAYVLIPIPRNPTAFCERHHIEPNLTPFAFHSGSGSAVVQLGLNIALFVPLGALLHNRGRHGLLTATVAGFAGSGLIELTQLTGVWWLYPCAYRHFDVDDIIFNTIGAAVGALVARAAVGRRQTRPSASPQGRSPADPRSDV